MSGVYDVSVCMGGNSCLSVVVMGFCVKKWRISAGLRRFNGCWLG